MTMVILDTDVGTSSCRNSKKDDFTAINCFMDKDAILKDDILGIDHLSIILFQTSPNEVLYIWNMIQ